METQGLFGDGKPFNLEDAIRQDETLIDPFDGTASSIDFPEYERRMRDLE